MGGILHFHSQRTTAQKIIMILIFNAFFMFEDSGCRLERAIQRQISDRVLESDFLNLITNSPALLGDRDLPTRRRLSFETQNEV